MSSGGEVLGVDGIPGILDQYTLEQLLEVEFARARRYDYPFALLRVTKADGDGAVLRRAAGALRLHTRWADSVGAFGDGALLVLLRDTHGDGARSAVAKIRASLEEELGPAAAAGLTFESASWRKGDDRERMLARLRPVGEDA